MDRISPANILPADITLLLVADENNPQHCHIPPQELITGLWTGRFELWRVDTSGIVLTEVVGDRLNVVRLAGKALGFRLAEIADALQHRARELNCTSIETMVYSQKLIKAIERIGAKREAVNMVLELKNG